jgi:D-alanyl-D-alanine carboxypeptidase
MRITARSAIALLCLIFAAPTASHAAPAVAAPAPPAPDLAAQLDAELARHFPADQPGAAVLVRKGDKILLRKAYGSADLEHHVPLKPEMVFRIGSLTKQFTAAGIMILVDAGKLSLKDDLRKWVPAYPDHKATITIENLLTHTSGVPSYTDQPGFRDRARDDLTHEQLLAIFNDLPLEFPPGTKWKYSNSGYYLLGLVIEKVAGQSYAQFVAERIFKPLGMQHTRYGDRDPVLPGGLRGYDRQGKKIGPADPISMKPPFAAGALISSVDDLALWDRAIAQGKLLKKASWQRVFTPMKLRNGEPTRYGFGWGVSDYAGHPAQSHGGGIPGFASSILRLPDDQVLVVILCNSVPPPVDLGPLALKLAAQAIGKPIVDPPVTKIDPALLDRYAGVYTVGRERKVLIRRAGDHLTVQMENGPRIDALPASDTLFFVKDKPTRLAFQRDPRSGRVTGIDTVRSDGSSDKAVRSDEPLPPEKAAVVVDPAVLERYVGEYQLSPGFSIVVTREGTHLFAQATGQPRFEIFASSPTEFFLRVVDAQVKFVAEGTGRAQSLVLHQNGRDVPGKRIK